MFLITHCIIFSNVKCTDEDLDITKCKAETENEFENSCNHDNDVGMRCYQPRWAGVRFGVLAERSSLQYLCIEQAGLLDYATNALKSGGFAKMYIIWICIHDGKIN